MRWRDRDRYPPPEGADIEEAEGGKLWRLKPRKIVRMSNVPVDPIAEAARIEAKQEAEVDRYIFEDLKARWLAEFGQSSSPKETDQPEPLQPPTIPEDLSEKLLDYRVEGHGVEDEITTEDLIADMKKDALATQDVIAKLSRERRRKFTELLNVEKAELRNKAKATGVSDAREADVDRLLNLFARVGEA